MENTNPQSFKDVKIFAGDKFKSACDASYTNLNWKNDGNYKLHINLDMSLNNCSCDRMVYLSSIKNIYQTEMQKRTSFRLKEEEVEGMVAEMFCALRVVVL